jgi:hypothetical protein
MSEEYDTAADMDAGKKNTGFVKGIHNKVTSDFDTTKKVTICMLGSAIIFIAVFFVLGVIKLSIFSIDWLLQQVAYFLEALLMWGIIKNYKPELLKDFAKFLYGLLLLEIVWIGILVYQLLKANLEPLAYLYHGTIVVCIIWLFAAYRMMGGSGIRERLQGNSEE